MSTEKDKTPKTKPESEGQPEKRSSKLTPEVVALLGVIATIIAGLLGSPLLEKWGSGSVTPTLTAEIPTIQVTDTPTAVVQGFTPVVSPGDIVGAKGVVMVLVPAGEFTMGSDSGDDDEKPAHEVYLNTYYIDKYEVTNLLYKACVDASVCKLPIDVRRYNDPLYVNHPVVYVDWSMAQTFCEWRGARLPTEAEWEKAARGIDERLYPWGDTASCEQANYADCVGETTEVGTYKSGASPYGVYDMAGNVWEFVADWYLSDYYEILEGNSSNPQGPNSGNKRVIRGGDWESTTQIRSSYRGVFNEVYDDLGFRCARSETISAAVTAVTTLTRIAEEQNLPADIVDAKKVAMILVPAGEFTMGTNREDADSSEKPAHRVNLRAFYIDKYEVTNALYKACVDAKICGPQSYIGSSTRESYFGNTDFNDFPVVSVDWFEAKAFCEWRDARLPTEAEWEKAARSTDQRTYPWGEEIDNTYANFNLNIGDTTLVGSYENGKSYYGVYDMAGNVWEWVSDWYAEGYYKVSPLENPLGPELGKYKVFRGGAYYISSEEITTFNRSNDEPGNEYLSVGFRCAKDAIP